MRLLIAVVACVGVGCAGSASNVSTTAFRPSDVELFDNAVDLVEVPVIVEGDWSGDFERRVGRADVIAVVRVNAISNDFVNRRWAYRLTAKVRKRLKGTSSRELTLRVSDGERGYDSVRVNEDRLLENPFVVFVKWEGDPETGELIAHWHFSPDTDEVREKVNYSLRQPAQEVSGELRTAEE